MCDDLLQVYAFALRSHVFKTFVELKSSMLLFIPRVHVSLLYKLLSLITDDPTTKREPRKIL
jgi:hypothetical protein